MEVNVESEDRENEDKGDFGEQITEAPNAMLELRLRRSQAERFINLAELRRPPGMDDTGFSGATDDVRSHEDGIAAPRHRSRGDSAEGAFSAGKVSPVSAASFTKRSRAWSRRQSAGMIAPAESIMMSPGTISSRATSFCAVAEHAHFGGDDIG